MAKKPRADGNPNIVRLWPTTTLVKRLAHFQKVNPALLELFYQHHARDVALFKHRHHEFRLESTV